MDRSKADRMAVAAERLRELFAERGHVYVPDEARRRDEGWQTYKHGYELRFSARNRSELCEIRGLFRVVGIEPARSYRTFGGHVLPIYGAERVLRAIVELGLTPKLPRRRPPSAVLPAPPRRLPFAPGRFDAADAIADHRQMRIAVRLASRGPLAARDLSATGSQLARLRKHGVVAALPGKDRLPTIWALTPKGIRELRRLRRAHEFRRQ